MSGPARVVERALGGAAEEVEPLPAHLHRLEDAVELAPDDLAIRQGIPLEEDAPSSRVAERPGRAVAIARARLPAGVVRAHEASAARARAPHARGAHAGRLAPAPTRRQEGAGKAHDREPAAKARAGRDEVM